VILLKAEHGKAISTVINEDDKNVNPTSASFPIVDITVKSAICTVTYEARYLRYLLIRALDWEFETVMKDCEDEKYSNS